MTTSSRPRRRHQVLKRLAAHPGDGLLSDHIAGVRPVRRERVFVPHTCRSQYPSLPGESRDPFFGANDSGRVHPG